MSGCLCTGTNILGKDNFHFFQAFVGTVDLGGGPSSLEEDVATDAYVFMVNSTNNSWKLPIGYFLIKSLNGQG